jgi:hypothetical protein
MAILYKKCERETECPKEVIVWNYFDHEHVVGTHYKYYSGAKVMMEKDNWCLVYRYYTLPVIHLRASSLGFMALLSPTHIKSIQHGMLGLILDQDITFKELGPERCLVASEYRLGVPGWTAWFLRPLFERIIQRWFDNTWVEDAPMRTRRYKVWKMGFKDFSGIDHINNKTAAPAAFDAPPYAVELPIPKATSIVDRGMKRPFSDSIDLGYND